MSDIGKGDFVEVFRTWRGRPIPPDCDLRMNGVYRVESLVFTNGDGPSEIIPGAKLHPPVRWGDAPSASIPVDCLRPIYKPKRDWIERLKTAPKSRKAKALSHAP